MNTKNNRRAQRAREIVMLAAAGGSHTIDELVRATQLARPTVSKYLWEMVADGKARVTGNQPSIRETGCGACSRLFTVDHAQSRKALEPKRDPLLSMFFGR
jgi:DNA-binding IclR family transcriptional regulator